MKATRNKLKYLPGMVSLVLVPYLISFLAIQYLEIPKVRVMELNMPRNNTSEYSFNFDQTLMETKINFIEITLTGNAKEDRVKLDFAALETRRIIKENDSVHGVKLVFNDSAKYNSLIRILNIMDQEIARYYIYYDQMFWFYHIPENPNMTYVNITPWECGSSSNYEKHKPLFPSYIFDNRLIWIPITLTLLTLFGIILIYFRFKSLD